MCKISIVVPVYNKAPYLSKLIKCILDQSFTRFELILVDDGSTDGSGQICDNFSKIDNRVKVFHQENEGVSSARNLGIKKAIGKYICFVDADDMVENDFLYKLYYAIDDKADMAICDYFEIKNGKKRYHTLSLDEKILDVYEVVRYNVLGILWNKMFVRDKIKHLFEIGLSTCEDSIFCVQYYIDNRPEIAYVNEPLYGYLRNNDGLTASVHNHALYGINKYCSLYYSLVKEITDLGEKRVATHAICKVNFFLIWAFVFENISIGSMEREKILFIKRMINQKKYQKITKNVLIVPFIDRRAEKTTFKEYVYILFSLLKMERMIFIAAKAKRWIKPFKKSA